MRNSTALRATYFAPATNLAPKKDSRPLKERWSAIILRYPIKAISDIADCSTETVKNWRAARQLPQFEHALRLGSVLTDVRALIDDEMGSPTPQRDAAAIVAGLQQLALSGEGQEAALARALLGQINKAMRA